MDLSNPMLSIIPSLEGVSLRTLSRTSGSLTGASVARLAGVGSEAGMRKSLERLVVQGLVTATPAGGSILYAVNQRHVLWPAVQALISVADRALADVERRMIDLVEECIDRPHVSDVTLALFGSVVRGESTKASDIDVAVVFSDGFDEHVRETLVDALVSEIAACTGNACNVYAVSDSRLTSMVAAQDPLIASWREDARTIHGPDLRQRMSKAR
ncbi:nucleotidyltransferase family protein [Subtercola lobariae]|uniref:Polymerase nucleotidyl transferase domain-containing protein n=1 Tax=Subtercola lobariae TaxID=1588641 RepID=A0A917B4N0_9MICO|nr:nucleotidyltransferase domain-containing protein [Subtercola lobariae]GGF21548.1 hypothetical protein GCM10011399_14080 [Subtercola lobariae]